MDTWFVILSHCCHGNAKTHITHLDGEALLDFVAPGAGLAPAGFAPEMKFNMSFTGEGRARVHKSYYGSQGREAWI